MLTELIQNYSNEQFNQHLVQVLQSSRHCSSYGFLVIIEIVNLILKNNEIITLREIYFKSIAQNLQTLSEKIILHQVYN